VKVLCALRRTPTHEHVEIPTADDLNPTFGGKQYDPTDFQSVVRVIVLYAEDTE
jgi:hypothetical protein